MRIPIVAGNWKMYKTVKEAYELASDLKRRLMDVNSVKVVLCPPFPSLVTVKNAIVGSNLFLGAQNMHWEKEGAYTGEVSGKMLLTLGCEYVILGHSERRIYFGETNQMVNLKLKTALNEGLLPIVCVGEKLEEREAGKTEEVVKNHVLKAFEGINSAQAELVTIAYEPVWAIGTGKTATSKQAVEVHRYIRNLLLETYGANLSQKINILYGGSVKPENSEELLNEEEIDGALVGGASLNADSFEKIVRSAMS
jgi:triosephosphate isomerase (TIM)